MSSDDWKRQAAAAVLDLVMPGMRLGLGSGSTAAIFVKLLGERVRAGLQIVSVPTSEATARLAIAEGIDIVSLDDEPMLDLTVDGADEIDPNLRLIKGGGGFHLREKIVASASDRLVIIADASKKVETLGKFPLPIEVVSFGLASTRHYIGLMAADAGCEGPLTLRHGPDGRPFVTDSGNLILDAAFGRIEEPELLADALKVVPGVVEHGLFLGLADTAILGGPDGVEVLMVESEA
jgi:ribose 5-phosphate isomerase A